MQTEQESAELLFEQALALEPELRPAFLDRACHESAEVRELVEQWLDRDEKAGSFMRVPIFGLRSNMDATLPSGEVSQHHPTYLQSDQFREGDLVSGRFLVIRFIANGGMGEVYEVEDRNLRGVRLALKTILQEVAGRADMQERFEREVLLARSVVHPNLCPIYDIFHCRHRDADLTFLTMKLLTGETLAARVKRDGPLSVEAATPIVLQVAAALTAAHESGILHRDIKAANIMLEGNGAQVHACVTDFGLARAYRSESTVLTADGVAGTPGYVAPELFHGARPSIASDVYAFGVLVYQMLTGHLPPVRLSSRPSRDNDLEKLPPKWRALIEGSLAPDPSDRYQTIAAAAENLHSNSPSRPGQSTFALPITRRRLIGFGAAATAGAATGVWLNWSRIDNFMHPLPDKRFVALLGWPAPSDARVAPMVTAAVDAIGNELARAEAFDSDLFVIPQEARGSSNLSQLDEIRESVGANLVLAASAIPGANEVQLLLRVIDTVAKRTLRHRTVTVGKDEQLSLMEKAVSTANDLLNIRNFRADPQRTQTGTNNPAAYRLVQEADQLRKQENDEGLNVAIEKYKAAIDLDPRYAVALAKLSWAYLRSNGRITNDAQVDLARQFCIKAIGLDPNLVDAHLGLASVYELRGNNEGARAEMTKALTLDPENTHTLIYQANFYADNNNWAAAEETFARACKLRPNYWLTHQELGVLLDRQGKYREALAEFNAANVLARKNALPLKNIGTVYLQTGNLADARTYFTQSFELSEMDNTAVSLAEVFRIQKNYSQAKEYALKAKTINPKEPYNWFELGDVLASAGKRDPEIEVAYKKAAALQEEALKTSPQNGPALMLSALCHIKSGQPAEASQLYSRAEAAHADDIDSQLFKIRILELLGRREDALATAQRCMSRGPMDFQIKTMPDLEHLTASPEYKTMQLQAKDI